MKKNYFGIFLLEIIIGMFWGCDNSTPDTINENDDKSIVEQQDTVYLNHFMSGEYFGDISTSGSNFISILLSDGVEWDRKKEGYNQAGKYVLLEINSKMKNDYLPEVGIYQPIKPIGSIENTFNPGELVCSEGPCYALSTYYSEVDETGNEIFTPLVDGSIKIEKDDDGIFTITMDMKDEDGYPFYAIYKGELPLIFIGYKYEPREASSIKLELTKIERAQYWGDFFKNGTSDMLLDFTTADGQYGISLELYAPETDRTSITPGKYPFSIEGKAMTAKPGYFNGYGTLYPSYAFKLGTIEYENLWWMTQGSVNIERTDNEIYTIKIEGYSYFGSRIEAIYQGKIAIENSTSSYAPKRKAPRQASKH